MGGQNQSSNLPGISFTEPNGSYAFVVYPPVGYAAFPESGNLNVTGTNLTKTVNITALPGPSGPGISPWAWLGIVLGSAAVLVLVLAAVVVRRRRRSPPPLPEQEDR